MAEHWIAAAVARDLIGNVTAISAARRVLCTRAHSGLLATKARLLIYGRQRATDASIPPAFWWAKGEAALTQDWGAGDFSTWIDHKVECRAFGVMFALSGILEMLPAERRADTSRGLSVASQPDWAGVAAAAVLACKLPGVVSGRDYLVEQARLGLLQGQAVLMERFTGMDTRTLVGAEREWPIPAVVWEGIAQTGDAYQQWDVNRLHASVRVKDQPEWLRLSGVHIHVGPLRDGLSGSPVPDPVVKPKAVGRPAQPWWDDLWCALWGLIHQGDFKPRTQAEVEKAMLMWAAMNGHEVSEATVRPKARKLFETYKGEATNFLAQ